jgi:crossover junction endodeoxyribonuclease RuvC
MRVLGVDPGSVATGWALLVGEGAHGSLQESGVVRLGSGDRAPRLAELERRFSAIVDRLRPDCAAVEAPFVGRNLRTSLALAESRGVIVAVLGRFVVPVSSYTPALVKSAVVGHGRAEKAQVVYMVTRLLSLARPPARDAADAMAVALTHLHLSRWPGGASAGRR